MKKKHISIGCGKLFEKSTDKIEWYNFDVAESLKKIAKEQKVNFEVCDIKKGLPFKDNEIDHVKAMAMLGQIETNKDFLFVINELHRILKLNGQLWIYLPNEEHPTNAYIDSFNQRRFRKCTLEAFDHNHLQYKNHQQYYGFKPWNVEYVEANDVGFLAALFTKI